MNEWSEWLREWSANLACRLPGRMYVQQRAAVWSEWGRACLLFRCPLFPLLKFELATPRLTAHAACWQTNSLIESRARFANIVFDVIAARLKEYTQLYCIIIITIIVFVLYEQEKKRWFS